MRRSRSRLAAQQASYEAVGRLYIARDPLRPRRYIVASHTAGVLSAFNFSKDQARAFARRLQGDR